MNKSESPQWPSNPPTSTRRHLINSGGFEAIFLWEKNGPFPLPNIQFSPFKVSYQFSGLCRWVTRRHGRERKKIPDVTGLDAAVLSCQVLKSHVNSLTGSALTWAWTGRPFPGSRGGWQRFTWQSDGPRGREGGTPAEFAKLHRPLG